MYNELRGFILYLKKSKRFLKMFINPNSLYIQLSFFYFIKLYLNFNVSYVIKTRYTLKLNGIMNTVENNNNQTAFKQVFPSYIFTDEIPEEPLALEKATADEFRENPNGTKYRICYFNKENISSNENYSFLVYLDNFQLTKEFRQGKSWKFEFAKDEEMIRRIIFPGQTTSRSYMPLFYKDDLATPLAFTSIDPVFDLQDCRINVALDAETLYISCWVYIGKNLGDLLNNYLKPPFNSKYWLLQDPENQNLARFELTEKNKIYILPPDKLEKLPENDMLVSLRTFNFVVNEIGVLDEGEYI